MSISNFNEATFTDGCGIVIDRYDNVYIKLTETLSSSSPASRELLTDSTFFFLIAATIEASFSSFVSAIPSTL